MKQMNLRRALECKAAGVCGIDISEDDVRLFGHVFQKNPNVHVALIDVRDIDAVLYFVEISI